MKYGLERFNNSHDEQTQYHQAVCDGSPHKYPIKHSNTGNLFNIETNTTTQPNDTKIEAARLLVRYLMLQYLLLLKMLLKPNLINYNTNCNPTDDGTGRCKSSISKTTNK